MLTLPFIRQKREEQLGREKEDYFHRITRQNLDHVKQLELELEHMNRKFNEREHFWTSKYAEAMEMIMKDRNNSDHHTEQGFKHRRGAILETETNQVTYPSEHPHEYSLQASVMEEMR